MTTDLLLAYDIYAKPQEMPSNIRGLSLPHEDGYVLMINDSIDPDLKWETLQHELHHISNNDFDREEPVEDIEAENPY